MTLATTVAFAAGPDPLVPLARYGNESVAVTDLGHGFSVNPAAGGLRYASEFAFTWGLLEPSFGAGNTLEPVGFYEAALSGRNFGLHASHTELAENGGEASAALLPVARSGATAFGLAFAGGRAIRYGARIDVLRTADGARATDVTLGALARPSPWASLGATVDHVAEPSLSGAPLARTWTLGFAARPLALSTGHAHTLGPRLTLSADVAMREGSPNDRARVRAGAELEVLPGMALRGAIETGGAVHFGIGLFAPRAAYHGQVSRAKNGEHLYQMHTVSMHAGEDVTVLAGPGIHRVAEIRVGGVLADETLDGFGALDAGGGTPVWWLHRQLERALEDPLTRGVLLDVRGVSGMAHIEELRPRIARLRAAGKPVLAYLEYGANRAGLYLASACDMVVTSPEAIYQALGLRIERRYYRSLLERYGVRFERTDAGRYKSAYREYSVDSTSAPDREVIERILDVNDRLFAEAVTRDRGIGGERLAGLLDGRRWSAAELQRAGLVDSLGHKQDALRMLGERAGLGAKPERIAYAKVPPVRRAWKTPVRIAIVYASGAMEVGESGSDFVMGPFMGSSTLIRSLEAAFKNPEVDAVVLRIESPGGSSLASNLMHAAVKRLKEDTKKPLVVSMGTVAASGGYHLAVQADRVVADRFTYTGSIGVLFVKPSLEGVYEKLNVRQEAFERGAYMGGLSLHKEWDDAMQAAADSATWREYEEFVADVAAGRGRAVEEIAPIAEGRVWMGDDAFEHGLIDTIGTLEDAVREARRLANISEGQRLAPAEYRRPRPGFFDRALRSFVARAQSLGVLRGSALVPLAPLARLPEPGTLYQWAEVPSPEARFGVPGGHLPDAGELLPWMLPAAPDVP